VPCRPGELTAAAYDAEGRVVARDCRRSFGEAVSPRVEAEAYGDLYFFTVTAPDEAGNPVENANRRVNVTVKGGELLGLDNGDATDAEPYQTGSRRMFNGKLLAIVRAEGDRTPELRATFDADDIPVRKIELTRDGLRFAARLLPENATCGDCRWRAADAAGIDSPLADLRVEADGRRAVLLPKRDGEVYVRCSVASGADHAVLISAVSVTLAGYGKPKPDPYGYISGGLYNASLRGAESHVGFRDLDFGPYGSDTFVIDLFALEGDPFAFEVWEGMPEEGGRKLADLTYDLGSEWNTYRQARYTLPERLTGVATLCFVFRRKVHIRGFRFEKLRRACRRLAAGACDALHGDACRRVGDRVEGIGNNVTLVYRALDFGATGAKSVTLCWRSKINQNAVQLIFEGENGVDRQAVNVGRHDTYANETFPPGPGIAGTGTLSLLFLPGCNLDLAWLRFDERDE
jgi:beta-galactosidase